MDYTDDFYDHDVVYFLSIFIDLFSMLLGGGIEDARQDRDRHRGRHGNNDPSYPPFGESTESEIVRGTRTWRRLPKQTEVVDWRK
jgi:hypothetical protein